MSNKKDDEEFGNVFEAMEAVIEILDNIHQDQKEVVSRVANLPTKQEIFHDSEAIKCILEGVQQNLLDHNKEIQNLKIKIDNSEVIKRNIYNYGNFCAFIILAFLVGYLYYTNYHFYFHAG